MESKCPICNASVVGDLLTTTDASLLRAGYKFYYSLIVPIPFVGSFIGSKLYDFISSLTNNYYKHLCLNCKCHWIGTSDFSDVKISGNNKLIAIFCNDTFVVGLVDKDLYTIQTQINSEVRTTIFIREGQNLIKHIYSNGKCKENEIQYQKVRIGNEYYIGETKNSRPNGWGFTFAKNGYLYYGKWADGKKNGVMFSVSLDGRTNDVKYWQNGNLINI